MAQKKLSKKNTVNTSEWETVSNIKNPADVHLYKK